MDVEEATLRAFIRRERRQRYVALLSSRVKRKKLLGELDHRVEGDLDGRFAWPLWRHADSPSGLYDFLRQRGAPERCHVISSIPELDGNEMDLREALEQIHATGMGTLISCIPGRLAYYEGELVRVFLERPAARA